MSMIQPGDKGIDFLYGQPSPATLVQQGIKFVACYLKRYDPVYITRLHDAGIATLPIVETGTRMMFGGSLAGSTDATLAVEQCQQYGIPPGTVNLFAHDSGQFDNTVADYTHTAETIVRAAGYGFGGYGGRDYFDRCRALYGTVFDIIWATNATSWLGGRHPDAHIWQGRSSQTDLGSIYDTLDSVPVDKDVCIRPFPAWLPTIPQLTQQGDHDNMFTNAEVYTFEGADYQPRHVWWRFTDDGTTRHIVSELEVRARQGASTAPAFTNSELAQIGL